MSRRIPEKPLAHLLNDVPGPAEIWAVDLLRQKIHRQRENGEWETAPVSTSRFGTGSRPDSGQTPVGWHQVNEIIGVGGRPDQEYISRQPVPPSDGDDRILSRILWLDGLETGVNRTSHDRYIYIHGTNHADRLGTPASRGCVRMDPVTIAAWTDALREQHPLVWIGNLTPSG